MVKFLIAVRHEITVGGPIDCIDCGKQITVFYNIMQGDVEKTLEFFEHYDSKFVMKSVCQDCLEKAGFEPTLWARRLDE